MERKTNNNILVPTDFSEIANNAVEHAISIAKAYKNEITLMYVIDEGFFGGLFSSNHNEMVHEAVEARLQKIAADYKNNSGVNINTRIEKGKVYKVIAEIANTENYDSIIMGSSGASGLEQVIGSNASRTIQYAEVPCVVVKQHSDKDGYKRIVMPIDLSIESRQKVDWAIHIGKKFNSEIHVVYSGSSDEFLEKKIFANIKMVESKLEEKGIKYISKEIKDKAFENFATEVLDYANFANADLILVMTHTEPSISEMVIGTLTQQLVNRSERIPVMCIHPHETGYTYDFI